MTTGQHVRYAPLGAAPLAIGVLLWLAAALLVLSWPWGEDPRFVRPLAQPAWMFHIAGVAYLVASGANHRRLGGVLRRGDKPSWSACAAVCSGHALVLAAVVAVALRGPEGRASLAQMAPLLALLAASSALSLLLAAIVWRLLRHKTQVEVVLESMHPRRRRFDGLAAAQVVVGLLVVVSLAYLETRELPSQPSRSTATATPGATHDSFH